MRLKLNESLILSSLLSMAASSLRSDVMKQLKSQMIAGRGRGETILADVNIQTKYAENNKLCKSKFRTPRINQIKMLSNPPKRAIKTTGIPTECGSDLPVSSVSVECSSRCFL